jgi:hypothetical protein
MKKIAVVLFSVILGLSASAQKVIVRPVPVRPPVVYYARPYPYYNPYFYGGLGFGYTWYNHPAYYNNHPTKMEEGIQNIEDDYNDRINSVKADDSLTGHERRVKVRELKHERDQAVEDYKKNYYKQYETKQYEN